MAVKARATKGTKDSTSEAVGRRVRLLALQRGPMSKLPTARELCDMFETSPPTLIRALDDLEAQNVIVRKDRSGIYVSPKILRKTIAVVINSSLLMEDGSSPFWGILLAQFAKYAETRGRDAGQDFEIFMTPPTQAAHGNLPDNVLSSIRAGAIHGVIAISLGDESARWLIEHRIPSVAFAGWSKLVVTTATDRFLPAGLQVLADQGCTAIEYWGPPRPNDSNPEWYEAMSRDVEAAYRAIGLTLPPTLIGPAPDLISDERIPGRAYRAFTAIKALFRDPGRPNPDGLLIGDDIMASGVLLGLSELSVRVGEDIKIATQSNRNSQMLYGTDQHFTLLEYDIAEIADALIDLLDEAMKDPDFPATEIRVPFRITKV